MPGFLAATPLGKYIHHIKETPKEVFNSKLILTVIMYALTGMPRGWDEGSTASITQLPAFQAKFKISPKNNPEEVSNIVSFVNITCALGAFLSFLVNDKLGRIWSFRLYMAIYILGNLIETFSSGSLPALYVGRLVAGAGIGTLTVVGPMAIVEIAPATTRGLMTLWFNIAMLASQMVGIFCVYGSNAHVSPNADLQWQIPFFVQCFVPAIGIIMSFFLYDSPRWLCMRGQNEKALETLTKLRGLPSDHPFLLTEWEAMSTQVARETAEYGNTGYMTIIRTTFCVRSNLRRVQLTVVAYILAQFSGANSVTNYLPEIFGLIGVESTSVKIYASGCYALAKLVSCIIASLFFVDVIGRRKSLFIGITVQMLCHSYLSGYLYFYTRNKSSVPSGASDMAIGAIFIHSFGWATGLYALPYLFGAEVWPNMIRSFGGALSSGFHWIFLFAITKATPSLLSSMAQWGAFLFFVGWCAIALVYCYIMVPETAGKKLENIDLLFEHPWYMIRKYARQDPQDMVTKDIEQPEPTTNQVEHATESKS